MIAPEKANKPLASWLALCELAEPAGWNSGAALTAALFASPNLPV
jgi:hypothetical protein